MSKWKLLTGPRLFEPPPPAVGTVVVYDTTGFDNALALFAGAGNIRISFADGGDYGSSILPVHSINPAEPIIIDAVSPLAATVPGFELINCSNIVVEKLNCFRSRASGGGAGVITLATCHHITIRDNHIHSDVIAEQVLIGKFAASASNGISFQHGELVRTEVAGVPNGGSGYYWEPFSSAGEIAISGHPTIARSNPSGGHFNNLWLEKTLRGMTSGATVTIGAITSNIVFLTGISGASSSNSYIFTNGNEIENVKWGIAGSNLTHSLLGRDRIRKCYQSFYDLSGDISFTTVQDTDCYGIYCLSSDGQPSGTNGPHSSLFGLSQGTINTEKFLMCGGVFNLGTVRFELNGEYAGATAPKMNDNDYFMTASISGDILTVEAIIAGGLMGSPIAVGHTFYDKSVLPGTKIIEVISASGGVGTYRVDKPQNVSSRTICAGSTALGWEFRNCIWISNSSLSLELGACVNLKVRNNTLATLPDSSGPNGSAPSIYMRSMGPGCQVYGNVCCGFGFPTSPVLTSLDDSLFSGSFGEYPNWVCVKGATTGKHSLNEMFVGLGGDAPFSGSNPDNILAMLTPKPGGPLDGTGIGHAAFYDWENRVAEDFEMTLAAPTAPTGVDHPFVAFSGSAARYTKGAGPMLDFTNPSKLFILARFASHFSNADTTQGWVAAAGSNLITRTLGTGSIRFNLKGTDGVTTIIETFHLYRDADGPTLFVLSVDMDTGEVSMVKATADKPFMPDPFLKVTAFSAGPLVTTGATVTLGGSSGATPITYSIDVADFIMTDQHRKLYDQSVLSATIAQDGLPLEYGLDAALILGGVPARAVKNGPASKWMENGNDGTAGPWVMIGSVTDV